MRVDGRNGNNYKEKWMAFERGFKDFHKGQTYEVKYITWQNRGNTVASEGVCWDDACLLFIGEFAKVQKRNKHAYGREAPWVKGRLKPDIAVTIQLED